MGEHRRKADGRRVHEVNHKLRSRRFQVAKATVLVDLIQSGQLTKV